MSKRPSTRGRTYRSAEEYMRVNYPPSSAWRPRSSSSNEELLEYRAPVSAHVTKIAEVAKRRRERELPEPL
jgi:hypothetical protein